MARKKPVNFEAALEELEELVERMEDGDLTLEESLAAFEKGVRIARDCQDALKQAEQRVQVLLADAGEERLQDFATDEDEDTDETDADDNG